MAAVIIFHTSWAPACMIQHTKKRLREKNTQQFTASFTMLGDVQLVAGATVKLKGFQKFDRKYKITKATHKLTGGYTTQIELQQVLEGY